MKKRQRIASYALIVEQEHLLMVQHSRGPNRGKWGLPGGGVEYGEHPLESLAREIMEETGIKARDFELDDILSGIIELDLLDTEPEEFHNVGIVYQAKVEGLVKIKSDPDGISSLGSKWIPLDGINISMVSQIVFEYLKQKQLLKI